MKKKGKEGRRKEGRKEGREKGWGDEKKYVYNIVCVLGRKEGR